MRFFRLLFCFLLILLAGHFSAETDLKLNDFIRENGGRWSVHRLSARSGLSLFGHSENKFESADIGLKKILSRYSNVLGISGASELKLLRKTQSQTGTHFYLQQYYDGFPILGAEISAHFNSQNQIIALSSSCQKFSGELSWNSEIKDVLATLRRVWPNNSSIVSGGLKVLSETNPKLVWHLEIYPEDISQGSWAVWIDASDPQIILSVQPLSLNFDGSGLVWPENPVKTPKRLELPLKYLDASKSLTGNFSRILNANAMHDVVNPVKISDYTTATNPNRKFDFPEEDLRSVEAMAYYHISRVHDRWKSLGFNGLDKRAPIFVNVAQNGRGFDNAYYHRSNQFKNTGIYVFGAGDQFENFGKDADLYYHEYAHGVLDKIRPEFLEFPQDSVYLFTFHEAFSDISAAALTGNSKIGEFALRVRHTHKFTGRNLQNTRKFPGEVIDPQVRLSEPHYASLIFSGAWWDLKKLVGVDVAQRLLLESVHLMPTSIDFFLARDALITADQALYSGAHRSAIMQSFARHGLAGENPGPPQNISVGSAFLLDQNSVIRSEFNRGSTIDLALEYSCSGKFAPGYYLVPDALKFQKPAGSNAFIQWGIPEIFSGQFQNTNAVVLLHVITDSNTTPGSYTLTFTPKVGATNRTFETKSVSFQIQ